MRIASEFDGAKHEVGDRYCVRQCFPEKTEQFLTVRSVGSKSDAARREIFWRSSLTCWRAADVSPLAREILRERRIVALPAA